MSRMFKSTLWVVLCTFSLELYAHATIKAAALNTLAPVTGFGRAIYGLCYVAGTGFILGAIVQYKHHRDNPSQIRIGAPIALLAVGVVLVFLPKLGNYSQSANFLN